MTMKFLFTPFFAAMLVAAMVVIQGCSVIDKIEESPMTAELITNQITLRIIAGAENPVERAQEVRDTLTRIKTDLGEVYTLSELNMKVREEINWQNYSLADQELLNFALTKAGEVIAKLIGDEVVDPEERYRVETLFRWIDQAAARVR